MKPHVALVGLVAAMCVAAIVLEMSGAVAHSARKGIDLTAPPSAAANSQVLKEVTMAMLVLGSIGIFIAWRRQA